jgi:hypothetical protein
LPAQNTERKPGIRLRAAHEYLAGGARGRCSRPVRMQTGTRACDCIKEAQIAINGDMWLTLVVRSLEMGNKDRKKDKKKPKKIAKKTPDAK